MTERTNKRNLCYNKRHRQWGRQAYMIDIDSVECDKFAQPVALVETKYGVGSIDLNSFEFDVLCNLARGVLPVFCVIYFPLDKDGKLVDAGQEDNMTHIQFVVVPVNDMAKKYVPRKQKMTEVEWVEIIKRLHGLTDQSNDRTLCSTWVDVQIPNIMVRS